MDMPQSRYPVNPTNVEGLELPSNWAGLPTKDVGHMNRIIRSLQHTHEVGEDQELVISGGRWVSSDLDVVPGTAQFPNNWTKVSGGSDIDITFGNPTINLPRTGFVVITAHIAFQTAGTNPTVVGDRLYAQLLPGHPARQYLDVVRITGTGGLGQVTMFLQATVAGSVGLNAINVWFNPAIDNAGTEKTVRRGTSLEVASYT